MRRMIVIIGQRRVVIDYDRETGKLHGLDDLFLAIIEEIEKTPTIEID